MAPTRAIMTSTLSFRILFSCFPYHISAVGGHRAGNLLPPGRPDNLKRIDAWGRPQSEQRTDITTGTVGATASDGLGLLSSPGPDGHAGSNAVSIAAAAFQPETYPVAA